MDITSIILSDEGVVFIDSERTNVINDDVILKNYFENLAKKGIKRMTRTHDKVSSSLTFNDNTRIKFQNFNEIRKKSFCKELNKQISIFKLKEVAKKLSGKNLIIAGSIVGAVTIGVASLDNVEAISNETIPAFNDVTEEDYLTPITIELEDINEEENKIESESLEGRMFAKERDYSNINIDDENDVDPLSLIEDDEPQVEKEVIKDNPAPVKQQNEINVNELNQNTLNTKVSFDDLRNFTSYDEYIKLAADLYGVNIDKAYEIVKANYQNFTTPGKVVDDQYAQEIDRMKDLTNRGFIHADLNVIGIFLTVKDYAIDNLGLSKQAAIHSDKTQEEREKDVINIARYIYGIDDSYLLNLLIATTRVESANFTSAATINKNNIGGNMSTAGTFEHPVLNTYKTAEIGEESFVRNFLNCYGKSLVAHGYDRTMPIPYVMKDKLCPHTPDQWARVITEKVEYVQESGVVDAYLNNSSKSI